VGGADQEAGAEVRVISSAVPRLTLHCRASAALPDLNAIVEAASLKRGAGKTELIEGGPEPKRIVIIEFPDGAAFKRWYNCGSLIRRHTTL
jgi:Domain of unknown function (DUF1330)